MQSDRTTSTLPEVVQALCDASFDGAQLREEIRYPKSLSIILQPLNDDFRPDGDPFWVLSRDVSQTGLGFIDVKPMTHQYVKLRLLDHEAVAVCRVRHCTSLSTDFPVYLTGIEFLEGETAVLQGEDAAAE